MVIGKGVQMPTTKYNSLNAIANSNIWQIEYDKLSSLADIEERKENPSKSIEKQMDYTFQIFEKKDRKKKDFLKMIIWYVVGAEKELQSKIEKLLKK